MDKELDIAFRLVDDCVCLLAQRLQLVLKASGLPGKVGSSTHKTPLGILGYVSFSPHQNPEEENVDATILVNLVQEYPKISADICWSDGEMIDDLGEYEIDCSSLDDLTQEIQLASSRFEKKVFGKMVELITSNLQPKYRND